MKTFEQMIEGYARFRQGDWQKQHDRWEQLKEGQSPQVMVIACSDSRVDPAQIFDVDPGEIFVVRNVAALRQQPLQVAQRPLGRCVAVGARSVPNTVHSTYCT